MMRSGSVQASTPYTHKRTLQRTALLGFAFAFYLALCITQPKKIPNFHKRLLLSFQLTMFLSLSLSLFSICISSACLLSNFVIFRLLLFLFVMIIMVHTRRVLFGFILVYLYNNNNNIWAFASCENILSITYIQIGVNIRFKRWTASGYADDFCMKSDQKCETDACVGWVRSIGKRYALCVCVCWSVYLIFD